MSLDDTKIFYVHHCKIVEEMWDTLEMKYEDSPSIEQEEMNPRDEENEDFAFKFFSKFRNIRNCIRTFVASQYLRV